MTVSKAAIALEELACSQFTDLRQAELLMLRAAAVGEIARCGPAKDENDLRNDLAESDKWDKDHEIRAEVIRWLCVNQEASGQIDPRGIWVHAAKVIDELDLSYVTVPVPIRFLRCRITDEADLSCINVPELGFTGSRTRSLNLDGANVSGAIFLDGGFSGEGLIRMMRAEIGLGLFCNRGAFRNSADAAISADGIKVGGSVFLGDQFRADGEVRLPGAQIAGNLECSGGTFNNPQKVALNAERAKIDGSVLLRSKFIANGDVRMLGSRIGGNLDCDGGAFHNAGLLALSAHGAEIAGYVFLRNAECEGEVALSGAEIRGNLECDGSTLKNPNGRALFAENLKVGGGVLLRKGFCADGRTVLVGAQIDGVLNCEKGTFGALKLNAATVKGVFRWSAVQRAPDVNVDLRNATVGSIEDDEASWPAAGNLRLDGFCYTRISAGPTDARMRLHWLLRTGEVGFTPQPYRQLAKVLRESGDERGARHVLFEMEGRRRKERDHNWRARSWSRILRWTIGYGQKSHWAFRWLWGLALVGATVSGLAYLDGAVVPSNKEAYEVFVQQRQLPAHYPRFNAFIYSIEHSFPLVNLGVKDHWEPNPGRNELALDDSGRFCFDVATFLRVWNWVQIPVGWGLATLFVAGLTGIVKSGP